MDTQKNKGASPLKQSEIRKIILYALQHHALPYLINREASTIEVRGHDVSWATGVIKGIELLEDSESSVILTMDFEHYEYEGAMILLEEIRENEKNEEGDEADV